MPYAPGVQPMQGQLLAQGIDQGIQGLAQGFRAYQANQLMTKQAVGKFMAASQVDPGILQFINDPQAPKEASGAYQKLQSGGSLKPQEAAMLASFADTYMTQKQQQQEAALRQQQAALAAQKVAKMKQDQADEAAFLQGLREVSQPTTIQAPSQMERAIQGGARFENLGGLSAARPAPVQQTPDFADIVQDLAQKGIPIPPGAERFLNAGLQAETRREAIAARAAGGTPTAAQNDTEAIINAELRSGKLKPENIDARRADLLKQGGRDQGAYITVGTYVRRKDRSNPITVVNERKTGRIGYLDKNGNFQTVDTDEYMPSTTSDSNPYMNPEMFSKFAENFVQKENDLRAIMRFMGDVKDLPSGIEKLGTRIGLAAKTVAGLSESDLTDEEKKLGLSAARQQRLLGAMRTTVLGPGVLTEIDAKRLLAAAGGDVNAISTNPAIMNQVLSEILGDKYREYEMALNIYNSNVAGMHGTAGYKQATKIPLPATTPAPMTADDVANKWLRK